MGIIFPQGNDRSSFNAIVINERMTFGFLAEKIIIGEYKADIDRSWTKEDSTHSFQFLGSSKTIRAEQNYSFKITGTDDFNWDGKCYAGAEVEKESIRLFKKKMTSHTVNKNNMACEFNSGDKKIFLYIEGPSNNKTGYIRFNEVNLDIIMKFESVPVGGGWTTSNNTIGYQIYNNGILIAVIGTTLSDKALYVRKDIEQTLMPVLLNSAVALVAYKDMSSSIKNSQ